MKDIKFTKGTAGGNALDSWLWHLNDNHGERAAIRRCRDQQEVALQPSFVRFAVREFGAKPHDLSRLAMICGLSAHLKPEAAKTVFASDLALPRQMAKHRGDSKSPIVSSLRFRRLLQLDRNHLYRPMVRIIRMLDGAANLYDLADSMYFWGDHVQRRWAFDYFPRVSE
jgi:CRISPR system Cascade subunit CasB